MDGFPPEEVAYQTSHASDNRSDLLIAVSCVFTSAAVVAFIIRIIARRVAKAKLGWDDYLSLAATVALIGTTISACLSAHFGIGRHLLVVAQDPMNFVRIGKLTIAFGTLYNLSMTLSKLAVLALFHRIFTLSSRFVQIGIYFFAVYTVLWSISGLLVIYLQCRPFSSNWGEPFSCRPAFTTSIAVGVVNIVSDVAIMALPQPVLYKLQLSLQKKLAVSFVFMIGSFATIVSIARIPMLKGANSGAELDSTYTSVNGMLFTVIEPACVVLCGSLPMFPGLLRRLKPDSPSPTHDDSAHKSYEITNDSQKSYFWKRSKSSKPGYGSDMELVSTATSDRPESRRVAATQV